METIVKNQIFKKILQINCLVGFLSNHVYVCAFYEYSYLSNINQLKCQTLPVDFLIKNRVQKKIRFLTEKNQMFFIQCYPQGTHGFPKKMSTRKLKALVKECGTYDFKTRKTCPALVDPPSFLIVHEERYNQSNQRNSYPQIYYRPDCKCKS